MTDSILALIVLSDVPSGLSLGAALLTIFAMILQAGVFITCLVVLYHLWRVIFQALRGLDTEKARMLVQLIGGVSAEHATKHEWEGVSASGKAKIAGTGVLGTIIILVVGCLAIYLIGNHSFARSEQSLPQKDALSQP